jgi:hypothetical protein
MNNILNSFGEPELLDDLLDHWSSSRHYVEKGLLMNDLRQLATDRKLRITIISGDVHLAAYGFISSTPTYDKLAADPGFMPQVRVFRAIVTIVHGVHCFCSFSIRNRINALPPYPPVHVHPPVQERKVKGL